MAGENSARLITTLEARVNKFEKDLARANGTARREFGAIEKRASQMTTRLDSTVNRSNPFAGLASKINVAGIAVKAAIAGFAAGAVGEFSIAGITDSIGALAKLQDTADRTGLSTKVIQEFGFAVEQSGGQASDAAEGLQKFAINSSKAAQGSGDLAKIFTANNVALRDSTGALRPVQSLLGAVANLIQNASSEQDRLNIATAAFGRSAGPALVLALSGGEKGMADLASQARATGNILDEGLIKKAAELDDRLTSLSSSLSGIGKQLAVEFGGPAVVAGMQALLDNLREVQFTINAIKNGNLGDAFPFFANTDEGKRASGSRSLKAGIGTSSLTPDQISKFYDRTGAGSAGPDITIGRPKPKSTVLPSETGGGRSRDKEAAAAKRQAESVKTVIDALTLEANQIGKTAEQSELLQRISQAGVDINSKEGQAIQAKVATLYQLKSAQDAVEKSAENAQRAREEMVDIGKDATKGFVDDLRNGVSAADAFANALDKIASKLLDMAINSLFESAFPTGGGSSGGGGIFSALGSLFGGGRAAGGSVRTGVPYVVGEKRPELFVPGQSGTIVPRVPDAPSAPMPSKGGASQRGGMSNVSSTTVNVSNAPIYNVQGSGEDMRRMEERIRQNDRELPSKVVAAIRQANRNNVKLF